MSNKARRRCRISVAIIIIIIIDITSICNDGGVTIIITDAATAVIIVYITTTVNVKVVIIDTRCRGRRRVVFSRGMIRVLCRVAPGAIRGGSSRAIATGRVAVAELGVVWEGLVLGVLLTPPKLAQLFAGYGALQEKIRLEKPGVLD